MPTEPAHHHAHGPANRRRRVLRTAAPLFVRSPRGPHGTAVLVLHDVYGLTERIEECCRELARAGHIAVAPYFYYETGGEEFRPGVRETAQAAFSLLAADDLAADVAGAVDHLDSRLGVPARAVGVLGVGVTGPLASEAAADHGLATAVACGPLDESAAQQEAIRRLHAGMPQPLPDREHTFARATRY